MEWHVTNAQSLAITDHKIGEHIFSPAEYEIVRRVIHATADFEYKSLIRFSEQALHSRATALATRSTIVVDLPMVQAGIAPQIQGTTHPQKEETQVAWGIETLARRYPKGIFVIGQSQTTLTALVELIEGEEISPALVIGTPSGFVEADVAKERLHNAMIPHIRTDGYKGSAVVAVAIVEGLVDLAWQAYGNNQLSYLGLV